MNTTMRERKVTNNNVTKFKVAALTVLTVGAIGSSAYALGDQGVFNSQVTSADTSSSSSMDQSKNGNNTSNGGDQDGQVISALNYYMNKNYQVSSDAFQVYDLQTSGGQFARGKIDNGDSGSVFYAVKSQNRWQIVFNGQMTPSTTQMSQFGLPSSWAGQTSW